MQLHNAAVYHWGNFSSGGKVYGLLSEQYEFLQYGPLEWIVYFFKGWYHFLSEPISFSMYSSLAVPFFIYKILFLSLFVFSILGFLISFRHYYKYHIIFLLFFFIFGSIFAMTEANIGTMVRHRDLIAPVMFIYVSFFILKFIRQKSLSEIKNNAI